MIAGGGIFLLVEVSNKVSVDHTDCLYQTLTIPE